MIKNNSKTLDICNDLLNNIKKSSDLLNIDDKTFQEIQKCISNKNKLNLVNNNLLNHLYPHLDDINFSKKIAIKKEFNDAKMPLKTKEDFDNIEQITEKLCDSNREFELEPHQNFIRNFLSFQTPYNSLLLYHGLGTGKTCSSITVCEEMRSYLNQLGINKRIIVVASSVVQENYKLQLFDSRKLKNINGLWNIKSCTGNKFIKEINPMNMKNISREKVIQQINKIINQSYLFLGYTEFANYINRIVHKNTSKSNTLQYKKRAIHNEFSNRLLIIDEVHNVRNTNKLKRTSKNLLELITYSKNMKLLLLTATPMFNDYKEIIWLLNLMNLNDNRYPIKIEDVFDSNGRFVKNKDGVEIGKELLIQKMIGYVSYVKGENPFKFPYRIWPHVSNNELSLKILTQNKTWNYPEKQINLLPIENPIKYLDIIVTNVTDQQLIGYNYIIKYLKEKNPILNQPNKGLQYTITDAPLQALNIVYPHEKLNSDYHKNFPVRELFGKIGLNRTMQFNTTTKKEFEYKKRTIEKYGRFFAIDKLSKYSAKLFNIMSTILKSKGIVLIYSQFIDGGCVPIALALEEMGFKRFGDNNNLFKKPPTKLLDSLTMKPTNKKDFNPASYIMITGDKKLSPNNKNELKMATNVNNVNGETVKVIIISKAGSEGLDFKNVRQIHLLEPWYNLNRTDQVIGRGVRNLSHCQLPLHERNTELFLYGSDINSEMEAIDLYMYRLAEKKSIKIGKITRLLKEYSVDCILNKSQISLSENIIDKKIKQTLSSTGETVDFSLGDKNDSILCDFMNCDYSCKPNPDVNDDEISYDSYNESYIIMNLDKILRRIKLLFKERYIYEKNDLIQSINAIKQYPKDQIMLGLNTLINDKTEYLTDMVGRLGNLINIDQYYLFQPIEIKNTQITSYERKTPVEYKNTKLTFPINDFKDTYVKKQEKIDNNINKLLDKFKTYYTYMQNAQEIPIENKDTWIFNVAWCIYSLNKYNFIDKEQLYIYAFDHIYDSMNYNDKLEIIKYVIKEKTSDEIPRDLYNILDSIINKYIIETETDKGIAIANYSSSNKLKYNIKIIKDNEIISDGNAIRRGLGKAFFDKFKLNYSDINTNMGFLKNFKNTEQIVFKTKDITNDRDKGQRCSKGENKNKIINRINKILNYDKYIMNKFSVQYIVDQNNKSYSKNEIIQYSNIGKKTIVSRKTKKIKEQKKEIKINTGQLCAENELILRHYDNIKKDNKRYFLSTIETIVNNL